MHPCIFDPAVEHERLRKLLEQQVGIPDDLLHQGTILPLGGLDDGLLAARRAVDAAALHPRLVVMSDEVTVTMNSIISNLAASDKLLARHGFLIEIDSLSAFPHYRQRLYGKFVHRHKGKQVERYRRKGKRK